MVAQQMTLPNSSNITRQVLDNGITVLVHQKSSVQSVVVTGSLPAGAAANPPEKSGLAAMTAETLMRGTQNRDFDALHTELEMLGADLDVDAGRYKTAFGGKSLAEDLPTLAALLGDVLRFPAFPGKQVERLRGELLTSLNYSQQDTRYRARRSYYETLYPQTHPYHYSVRGTMETVPGISIDDMRAYHEAHYGPQGMIVVVVGNVEPNAVIDVMARELGDWVNPNQAGMAEIPPAPEMTETRRTFTPVPGKTQADIVMGGVGPSRYAEDYHSAVLANSVLGQFGMMGRIGDIVRETKGMAYYSYSSLDGGHGPGAWSASAGVDPKDVEETINDISSEFRRLTTEPVTEEEIADVQAYRTGHLPLQLESNRGVANTILRMESYGLGLDYLLDYHDMIYSLTRDDLMEAARRYINPDALTISVAGPRTG